jgi:hypothetical protein
MRDADDLRGFIADEFYKVRMQFHLRMIALRQERGFPPMPPEVIEDIERRAAEHAERERARAILKSR